MGLLIPLKNTDTSGSGGGIGSFEELIDSKYDLYSVQMKNYPVPNVYDDGTDNSQEAWGLQITSRANQNTAWKNNKALNAVVGTGVQNVHSFTGQFTANVKNIIDGSIQMGFFTADLLRHWDYSGTSFTNVNSYSDCPANVYTTAVLDSWGFDYSGSQYLAIVKGATLYIYPANTDYMPTSATATTSIAVGSYGGRGSVIWAKDGYIYTLNSGNSGISSAGVWVKKFSFDGSTLTEIDSISQSQASQSGGGSDGGGICYTISGGYIYAVGSAQQGDPNYHGRATLIVKITPEANGNLINGTNLVQNTGYYYGDYCAISGTSLYFGTDTVKYYVDIDGGASQSPTRDDWTGGAKKHTKFDKANPTTGTIGLNYDEDGVRLTSSYVASTWNNAYFYILNKAPTTLTDKESSFLKFLYLQNSDVCLMNGESELDIKINGVIKAPDYYSTSVGEIIDIDGIIDWAFTEETINANRIKFTMTSKESIIKKKFGFGITSGSYQSPAVSYESSDINITL